MVKKLIIFSLLFVFLASCNTIETQTETYNVNNELVGGSLKFLSITSEKQFWEDQEIEVLAEFEEAINSGNYNIVSVKVIFVEGYFLSAEILYDSSAQGEGNTIRVKPIMSEERFLEDQELEVTTLLETFMNGGTVDVTSLQSIYIQDYLVAAIVYYRDK